MMEGSKGMPMVAPSDLNISMVIIEGRP